MSIRPVTVSKGWEVHPSKTPYYLITTWCKKPKNEHHENLKSYHLHLHHYALGGHDSVCGTVTYYTLNGLEFKSQWGCDFFVAIWTSPKAHPASSTQGTGSFLGGKRPGCSVDHPTPPSTPTFILCLHSMLQGKLNWFMQSAILK